jgi:hypothetical protein
MPNVGAEAAPPAKAVGIPLRGELGGASLAALVSAIPYFVEVRPHYMQCKRLQALGVWIPTIAHS